MKHTLIAASLVAALLGPAAARAASSVDAATEAKVLFSALAAHQKLPARVGDQLTVLVLFKEGVAESVAAKEALMPALQAAAPKKLHNASVVVVAVPYVGAAKLLGSLRSYQADAVVVTPGMLADVGSIRAITRVATVTTFSGDEALVREGLSLGAVMKDGKPSLLVNPSVAKSEGVDLDDEVLLTAEVVR